MFDINAIYTAFTTERDGASYNVVYGLPFCAASSISELSGSEIAVQTLVSTQGWEKRQIANVLWDYQRDTMYAGWQAYSYTIFHGTHTCYQDCSGWHDYYFSGGVEPSFTVPVASTTVEEPTITASIMTSSASLLSSTTSSASMRAAVVVTPTRLVLLGLFALLVAL